MDEQMPHYDPHNEGVHHEESDINVRAVIIGAVIVFVLAVVMHVGLWGMYVLFRKIDRSLDPVPSTVVNEPAPATAGPSDFTVHWSEPAKYLEVIREDNRKVLEEYGWVNKASGQVHVPIEVGMQMALERGYPTRQSTDDPAVGTGQAESLESARSTSPSLPSTAAPSAGTSNDEAVEQPTAGVHTQ